MAGSKKFPGARLDLHDTVAEIAPLEPATGGEAALSRFVEDTDNPRQDYDPEKFAAFVESIRRRGVITAVTAYPREDGQLQLVTGHRRLRAAKLLGLASLKWTLAPESQRGTYVQLEENAKRDDIEPMDKARAIAALVARGQEKKKDIAVHLGIDASAISHLLSLLQMPPCLQSLYESRICRQPKYLYDLRKLHEKNPELVERRCAAATAITQSLIDELGAAIQVDASPEGSHARRQRRDRKSKVLSPSTLSETRIVHEGRLAKVLQIKIQYEDGMTGEISGAELTQLAWVAADRSV